MLTFRAAPKDRGEEEWQVSRRHYKSARSASQQINSHTGRDRGFFTIEKTHAAAVSSAVVRRNAALVIAALGVFLTSTADTRTCITAITATEPLARR